MISELMASIIAYAEATKGWSQAELALRAGLTPEGLSRAKRKCHAETLRKIATAAGMKIIAIPDDRYLEKLRTGTLIDL